MDGDRRAVLVAIVSGAGQPLATRVKKATSFRDRALGLLGRTHLARDEGMLFEPGGSIHTWWMRVHIDAAFLDRELRVLKTCSQIPPWRWRFAPRRTHYTLELASGKLKDSNVRIGDQLRLLESGANVRRPG